MTGEDRELITCRFCGKSWEERKRTHHELVRVLVEALIWTAGTTVTLLIFKLLGL